MDILEACAGASEQVAHHADGKTAVREAGGIASECVCMQGLLAAVFISQAKLIEALHAQTQGSEVAVCYNTLAMYMI